MRKTRTFSRRQFMAGLGASTLAMATARRGTAAEPTSLKFATNDTMQDTSFAVGQQFGEEVAKRTNGKYRVQVFVGGTLGSGVNIVGSLQTGIVDAAIMTAGFLESFVPTVQVLDLPFIFKDAATAERILDGEVGRRLFADMEAKNMIGLAWGWYGWRQMETREKAIRQPEDLRGLKMRIQPAPVFASMFKAVGAIPVVLDGSETYMALSQKTVDGLEFPLPTVVTFKAYEVTKYLALTNHVYNAGALMVSKSRWSQLTEADREAFRAAAQNVLGFWRREIAAASDRAAQFCKDRGMQITETDFAAFRAKMAPVYTEFKPKYQELFDKIMAQQ